MTYGCSEIAQYSPTSRSVVVGSNRRPLCPWTVVMIALLLNWVIWASLGIGICVSSLVFVVGRKVGRRRKARAIPEEDLPWEDLLVLLKERYKGKSAADEKISSDELMDALLAELANKIVLPEADGNWSGSERRRARRRWANPVEVILISPFHAKPVHGLVINRSTGGLAILTDVPFEPETGLSVRSVEAPQGVGFVDVCVRHLRKASKLWVIGCQYQGEIAWNMKVWFG